MVTVVSTTVFIFNEVGAQSSAVTATIKISVCGNNVKETGEECDNDDLAGETCLSLGYTGGSLSCAADCTFDESQCTGPVCGNGVVETGEDCDGSNLNGQDCQSLGYASGTLSCNSNCSFDTSRCLKGGRLEPIPVTPPTKMIIKGKAYPAGSIIVLRDGKKIKTITADSEADFEADIDANGGTWTFGLRAKDKQGKESPVFNFTVTLEWQKTTIARDILLAPTIEVGKTFLKKGEELNIFGQTAPGSKVSIYINSEKEIVKETEADQDGIWFYTLDTSSLSSGGHTIYARAVSSDNLISSFSRSLNFFIGEKAPKEELPPEFPYLTTDLNKDGKVDIVDFSILLYWWGEDNPDVDLNENGIVDLPDFSILMYYWTG